MEQNNNEPLATPFEFVQSCTTKITCKLSNGRTSTGTGFFFKFELDGKAVNALVTNKHVVEDSNGGIVNSVAFKVTMVGNDGKPNLQDIISFEVNNFSSKCIFHPEPSVDLCIYPIGEMYDHLNPRNKRAAIAFLREREIPNNLEIYKPTEDIFMVGYPTGLADELHNLPLVRRGITATPFYIEHNGKPHFLVDCACFPGSSGSPILIVNEGLISLHNRTPQLGNRISLLGILYAGPQYNAQGQIVQYSIPQFGSNTQIPMNLGYCVNSKKLLDFKPILKSMLDAQNHQN